ncbi:MAG: PD-(D/E)XK motif protein [Campylobacteraceae bacterium]|nr:PD-(D/E)XK motif protein [Campylobacteraceae bacterium]
MTVTNENPWENLETPSVGLISSRRISANYPYDFYFAKDSTSKYMLVFSISKPAKIRDKILLNGISVGSISAGGSPSITLTLKNNDDYPIFLKICLDLCSVASGAASEKKAIDLFCNRLLYWQYFLKRNSDDKLSKEEQRGLIGELIFLENYLLSQYNALDSVNFWTGADADAQDFFIGNRRIEIKTCLSPSRNEVHISSLQQLYDAECDIFLAVAYIGVAASDAPDSFSLFSLSNRIAEKLHAENATAYEAFIKKLALVGLFLDGTYNDTFYVANKFKGFRVYGEFPRITPKDVKEGVSKANYIINLGNCTDYEISLEEVLKKE